ncbi:MAG: DUF1835 domain-containing protein [Kangiellaceae bacterium]|nr:DUF1835 domain-containing protein [Kangiellaceae bacterium]MCW8999568.1 DUF1835 domain-containing protein [Kangiellaceae bacterium]
MELHITNGSSAAGLLKETFQLSGDELLTVNDLLCCGPLTLQNDLNQWIKMRENYWGRILELCSIKPFPMSDLPRDFYFNYEELKEAEKVHIWLGTSLGDQMMQAFVIDFCSREAIDLSKIIVHQFHMHRQKQFEIAGVALLSPLEIKDHGSEMLLSESLIEELKSFWQAITSPTPERLVHLNQQNIEALPFLVRASCRLESRFPDRQSGLSVWEEKILTYVDQHGPKAASIIGHILGDSRYDLDLVGDLYLFALIKKLADPKLQAPLLELNSFDKEMHDTEVTVTETGAKVLSGESNMVELNGIDRHVGGISLSSDKSRVWYRVGNKVQV